MGSSKPDILVRLSNHLRSGNLAGCLTAVKDCFGFKSLERAAPTSRKGGLLRTVRREVSETAGMLQIPPGIFSGGLKVCVEPAGT